MSHSITLAMTGASGAPYFIRLLEKLIETDYQIYLLISDAGRMVLSTESDIELPAANKRITEILTERFDAKSGKMIAFGKEQWTAPIASGTAISDAMVICPCSTGCLSAIATGASNNLMERAADVTIKEQKKLILVPREMPLSVIHLEHMTSLAKLGAVIMPPSPGFYYNPQGVNDLVDFVVARILDHLGIENALIPKWG